MARKRAYVEKGETSGTVGAGSAGQDADYRKMESFYRSMRRAAEEIKAGEERARHAGSEVALLLVEHALSIELPPQGAKLRKDHLDYGLIRDGLEFMERALEGDVLGKGKLREKVTALKTRYKTFMNAVPLDDAPIDDRADDGEMTTPFVVNSSPRSFFDAGYQTGG